MANRITVISRSPRTRFLQRSFILLLLSLALLLPTATAFAEAPDEAKQPTPAGWYRGNIQCHCVWSDGDSFPELVADWYKTHGFHFLGLSDHNILQQGEVWRSGKRLSSAMIERTKERCGEDTLTTRGSGENLEYRLKTFDELARRFDEPGRFLMIPAQEINCLAYGKQVHVNMLNPVDRILPQAGPDVKGCFEADLKAVAMQAQHRKRSMLATINHPSWPNYDISPSLIASLEKAEFVEFCNNTAGGNNLGDDKHPGTERLWDIANTIRLARLNLPPIYGTASDDMHSIMTRSPSKANPGRGFVIVQAPELSANAIVDAMRAGDFYASNGVVLSELKYDKAAKTLHVAVATKPDTNYRIELVGTLKNDVKDATLVSEDDPPKYAEGIGKVLKTVEGPKATFQLTGEELYVRAVVRSDRRMADPPTEDQYVMETAWTQPVGWEK